MYTTEQIARVCHEANRAYCMILGDHSQPTWDMAPKWQKDSALAGVDAALKNLELTAQESHANWLEHKKKAGWTYGPVKAPEKLQHPCMKPWNELPENQRIKDVLFLTVVRALEAIKAEQVVREPEPPKVSAATLAALAPAKPVEVAAVEAATEEPVAQKPKVRGRKK